MNVQERQQFRRKAAADRLAWQIAERLFGKVPEPAAPLVAQGIALVGPERFTLWVRHYATMKFGVPADSVRAFLAGLLPEARAA